MGDSNSVKRTSVDEKSSCDFEKQSIQDQKLFGYESNKGLVMEEKSIGVLKAEILAKQWNSILHKIILLFSVFLIAFAYTLDSKIRNVFTSYATSSYSKHSLLTTVSVITSVTSAAAQPIYSRLSDVFGRLEIFLVSVMLYVIGTIIQSQAHDVERYAGGAILYRFGYMGVISIVLFILSDFSAMKWRLFYTFVPTFPYIINTWVGGVITEVANPQVHWSWDVGMWAFIFPLSCIPLVCCMLHMRWLAGKTEEWREFKKHQTKFQELGLIKFLKYLFIRLDVIGILLLVVACGCFLVPITIAEGISNEWREGHIIAPFVIGFVLFFVFAAYEWYSPDPIAPLRLLENRGIWSALIISFVYEMIFALEASYIYTVLIVAVGESKKSATVIFGLTAFVSALVAIPLGLIVVYVRRLKGFIILGTFIWMVAFGVMIKYRGGLSSRSGIIAGECLIGLGTTFFRYPVSISMQACTNHEHMATVIALGYITYFIGSAVGSAVASAIWSHNMYSQLVKNIGNEKIATLAYQNPMKFILSYTMETTERAGVVESYRYVQRILMIVCVCLCVPLIFFTFFLRDRELGDDQANDERRKESDQILNFIKRKLLRINNKSYP